METHLEHEPLVCVICHTEFHRNNDYIQHWRDEHCRYAVACKICGRKFINKTACAKHKENVHNRKFLNRINHKVVDNSTTKNNNNVIYKVRILLQNQEEKIDEDNAEFQTQNIVT